MNRLFEVLTENNYTISSCESYTGGSFASELTNIPGASNIFKGSIVSYANEIKQNVVKVDEKVLNTDGAVSYECAYQMAKNTQKMMNTDICVSFTGNAGPATMEDKDCGLVYIGLAFFDEVVVYKLNLTGSRLDIKNKSISFIIDRILKKIEEKLQNNSITL